MKGMRKWLFFFWAGLLMTGSVLMTGTMGRSDTAATNNAAREKVLRFVRARFGVPDNVTLTADALKPSIHPDFLQTTIISDNGKESSRTTPSSLRISVSWSSVTSLPSPVTQ